ncbi:MAG: MFS transporter [Clostridia bacterium]|jgi:EmrB/QacA subfamily drug resistance transporter|nr:MFS transporter [Clostridia bacterium]
MTIANRKYILIAVTTSSFMTPFMVSSLNLAIPSIGEEFGGDVYALSWVITGYLLASAVFLLPWGRLSDIVGRKKIFTTGIMFFVFSTFLCGLSWSLQSLLIFRIAQGIFSAMFFATSIPILTLSFSPQERGRVLGINSAAVYTGLSLGPVIGGWLNHHLGWQYIFFLTAGLAFLVLYFVLRYMSGEWLGVKGEKFDYTGSVLYGIALVAIMYASSSLAKWNGAIILLISGLIIMVCFVFYELRQKCPLIDVGLFKKNTVFAFSNLAALINYSATYAIGFLISLYLQVARGFDSQIAGLILLSQPVLQALFSPFAGRLSDRIEPRIVATFGMSITTIGLFIFSFLTAETPLWFLVVNLALQGIGFAFFAAPNNNAIMTAVEKKEYGVASAVLGTMRIVGQSLSMVLMTLVTSIYLGQVNISPVYSELITKSTRVSFLIFALICCGGIFASGARGNLEKKECKER